MTNTLFLDTRTDDFDHPQAKANAEDAIANHPNLKCMVGLFAYNPPLCLEAIRDAGKLKEIKVVSFDENEASLQGIMDGTVVGTVVQNPYQYGYESVRVLKALANGDKSVIPENEILHIPARKIRKDNVEEFWTELKSLLGDSAKKDQGQPARETTKSAKKTDPGATPDPRYPQQQKEPQKDE